MGTNMELKKSIAVTYGSTNALVYTVWIALTIAYGCIANEDKRVRVHEIEAIYASALNVVSCVVFCLSGLFIYRRFARMFATPFS